MTALSTEVYLCVDPLYGQNPAADNIANLLQKLQWFEQLPAWCRIVSIKIVTPWGGTGEPIQSQGSSKFLEESSALQNRSK